MAAFKGLVQTKAGEALFAKCLAYGLPFKVVRMVMGDGELAQGQDPKGLTAMINEKYSDGNISSHVAGDQVVQLEATMDAALITEGFWLREVGIFAEDPDEGEILYAYENAGEFADYIPVTRMATYMRRVMRILIKVADAANVQLTAVVGAVEVNVRIGSVTVETLPAGAQAVVRVTPVGDTLNFAFKLPRGEQGGQGPQGVKGEQGLGLTVLGGFSSAAGLRAAYPDGSGLDGGFMVSAFTPSHYFYWDTIKGEWADGGALQGVKGDDGADGRDGLQGPQGPQGPQGKDGKDGADGKANITFITATLPASGWTGTDSFAQTVAVSGVTEAMNRPIADVDLADDIDTARLQLDAWSLIDRISVGDGEITAYCFDGKPETDLTITLGVI